jgi:cytochrome b
MQRIPVWDIVVRVTHWTVAVLVIGELTVIDDDSALHRWAGYMILGAVALRLVWGLIGSRHARFSAFPPSLKAAQAHLDGLFDGRRERYLSHNPLGALMIYNLWASLIVICVTGIMMTTRTFWGVEWVEEVHEIIANWVMISVFLHLGGIIIETRRSHVNLVRAMITGAKEIPGPGE